MDIEHYLASKSSQTILGSLLSLGILISGAAAPALSQTSSGQQPTITPIQPSGASSNGQPRLVPLPSTPNNSQPQTNSQPQLIPIPPTLKELVTQRGLTPVTCNVGVVTIRLAGEGICVSPTPQFPSGEYTYDSDSNQLTPVKQQSITGVAIIPQFKFENALQYGECIEDILQLYQSGKTLKQQGRQSSCSADVSQIYGSKGISKSQALELIKSANIYATTKVKPKTYPFIGQRKRIAKVFGFTYEVDANDKAIQSLAGQASRQPEK